MVKNPVEFTSRLTKKETAAVLAWLPVHLWLLPLLLQRQLLRLRLQRRLQLRLNLLKESSLEIENYKGRLLLFKGVGLFFAINLLDLR